MDQLKRLRVEKGLSQARLAARAGVDPSTVNQIERGAREASPATLRKLAYALDVSLIELLEADSPKERAPLPLEDAGRRRFSEAFDLLSRWQIRRVSQANDPNDPHFRDATAAAIWVADVEEEAAGLIDWLVEHGEALIGDWEDLLEIVAIGLSADSPAWLGKERLKEMGEPDVLAARRLEKATATAEESRGRLEELRRAASG